VDADPIGVGSALRNQSFNFRLTIGWQGALSALRLSPTEFVKEMRVAAALLWYSHGEVSQSKNPPHLRAAGSSTSMGG